MRSKVVSLGMRLGLIGPALGHLEALEVAARRLRDDLEVDRVVYLGNDQALDKVVANWAQQLVGPEAEDAALLRRATRACLEGSPERIDDFVARERQRSMLRMFESLPGGVTRAVEILGGKVAVLVHDKKHLSEDDILPATLLIFGRGREAMIRQVGRRWFVSPGSLPHTGAVVVLEEQEGQLRASTFGGDLALLASEVLNAPKSLKMTVSGGD